MAQDLPMIRKVVLWGGTAVLGVLAVLTLVVGLALALAYPKLPDVSELSDYRPKLPLRVYSAEGVLIGEFGEELRQLTPIAQIPKVMKDAVIAIEDSDFYSHGGINYRSMLRAVVANLGRSKSQGASTITMQVARNVYLSSEKSYVRKIYEVLLTFKLESLLTKDQILEIYMNQIFLGERAYGFASAAEIYFGKPLKEISIAEAAMLAGLPKAPSTFNPIVNPSRARVRQLYIIERMLENDFITKEQAAAAGKEVLKLKRDSDTNKPHAEYVSEAVRQMVYAQYGADTYTKGLHVYTTIKHTDQTVAYNALRKGIMDFEKRQSYRGPELFVDLPSSQAELEDAVDNVLTDHHNMDDLKVAVVTGVNGKKVSAMMQNAETIEISGDGLKLASLGLSDKAPANLKIRRGAVIRVIKSNKDTWEIAQLPEVEGAFVALDPRNGEIKALVGGFDYNKNKFNHVTQAWRQPGSSFKPFIYSSSLEKGLSPATVINDSPLFFDASVTGGQPWEPKNYDGKFSGPMSMRTGLAKSKNMVSIRILKEVGPQNAQDWITKFGFEAERHPPYLTMALGAGAVTPLQMASAYSVFANGGYRVNPYLISKITDHKGAVIAETKPISLNETMRVIDARNAFVTTSLLQEVTSVGTAAKAKAALARGDIYGKTGTTNDSIDAWFAGFHPSLAAVVWMGYDNPKPLGSSNAETGGGLSLPIWISYMQQALKGVPIADLKPPEGVTRASGDWEYTEFAGGGIRSLGMEDYVPPDGEASVNTNNSLNESEKRSILDLFKH
ncbi:MAG TPA: penicillin-binding protein 1A [Burkholderiaceae bacterium]|nr:penicillin-binding protein 1A [Burkholderiaceae bacterium]